MLSEDFKLEKNDKLVDLKAKQRESNPLLCYGDVFRQESHTMTHFTISEPLLLYTFPLEAKKQEKLRRLLVTFGEVRCVEIPK